MEIYNFMKPTKDTCYFLPIHLTKVTFLLGVNWSSNQKRQTK